VPDSNVGFIRAGEAIGIPIVNELNNGNNTGVKQGTGCFNSRLRRSSSYEAFYVPIQNRTNLDVLHYASVTAIQFTKSSNGTSIATGVSFTDQPTGQFINVDAAKEVIVTMGAFSSPQLLMISVSKPWMHTAAAPSLLTPLLPGYRAPGSVNRERHPSSAHQRERRSKVSL
jgi:choline dehydrogenase-like flavoprotein